MEQQRTNDDHIQRGTTSHALSTPPRTTAWHRGPHPTSPEDQGTPNVRRNQDPGCRASTPSPARTEYSTHKTRPTTATRLHEGTAPGATTTQEQTGGSETNAVNAREKQRRSHSGPVQLDMEPHHHPSQQNAPTLCTHRNMQTNHSIHGRSPLALDTHTEVQRIHLGTHHVPQGSGDRGEGTRTGRSPATQAGTPLMDTIQTTGPCPHPSGAQHPTYMEAKYVEGMLQDRTKYETEVLEGHPGPPDTASRATWDDLVPDGDIDALAKVIQNTAPSHPLEDNCGPTIMTAIVAYHSWTTQQHIHLHTASDNPCEWHSMGPPALEVCLHENATTGAHVITNLRQIAQPIPELYIPSGPTLPHSPTEDNPPLRIHNPQTQRDTGFSATVQQVPSPSPRTRSQTTTSCLVRGTIPDEQHQHGNYRRLL